MDLPYELPAGQYVVYALIDPNDQLVYYVGQTRHPTTRLAQHLRTRASESAKASWVRSLRERGQQPIMEVLETVKGKDAALAQEREWMYTFLKQGMPLVNGEIQAEPLQGQRATQAITPIRLETILLCGSPLIRAWLPDNQTAIVFKHLAKALRISRPGQTQRIQRDPFLRRNLVYIFIETKGGTQIVSALLEEAFFSWITSINSGTFSPEKRQLLLAFQREAANLKKPVSTAIPFRRVSHLHRERPHRAMAGSKHQWRAMKVESASLKAKLAELEARIEKDEAAQQNDRILSPLHLSLVWSHARLLRARTGERIDAMMADLTETFGVEDVSDIPDARWDQVLSWFWQHSLPQDHQV